MTVRNPLVRISGKIVDLPAADSLGGAAPGQAATITIGTVTSVANGDPATVTNSGTSSAAVLDFEIPEGEKGDQGDPGDGVPVGGTTGEVLAKASNADFDTEWVTASSGSGDFVKISKVVTTSSATTITFSSIPGSYTDLKIIITGRDTQNTGYALVRLKINGDTTSGNYTSSQYITGYTTTNTAVNAEASSAAGSPVCVIPGVQSNANALGSAEITIPNYAGTVFHKSVNSVDCSLDGPTGHRTTVRFFVWKSTAAITDLVITCGGTAFVDGTTATLYGLG